MSIADKLIQSRQWMMEGWSPSEPAHTEEEGGCGVTGFACSIPVGGKHIYEPSVQMHNRGNGKGGGIAAVGLVPEQMGVTREILDNDYILQIALLDPKCLNTVEAEFVTPMFDVHHSQSVPHVEDYREIDGLDVRPPDIQRYFVKPKKDVLAKFAQERGLVGLGERDIEEEFMYQNAFALNTQYYAALGDKQAFVMSQGRNMIILKIVGYAELIVNYYQLDDFKAHVWIAHQRYPTRGRVWHPGGAHPFCGMNEALVHNGDFANYYSVCEYLAQRNIKPLFLTDTEVSILVFDLWNRVYKYPLEYIIEGLAPTSERDFDMLPKEKQEVYRRIQQGHIHASPDGPWFFIIARNDVENDAFQLLGITDTAMLRPQVFALQDGEVQIGLVCSEKQAIDATLASLACEDSRFCTVADDYWNARGGSYTDGGSFMFTVKHQGDGTYKLNCTDKFGRERRAKSREQRTGDPVELASAVQGISSALTDVSGWSLFQVLRSASAGMSLEDFKAFCTRVAESAKTDPERAAAINAFTLMIDRRYQTGPNQRGRIVEAVNKALAAVLGGVPSITGEAASKYARIDWETRGMLRAPNGLEEVLVVNGHDFPPEGDECDARVVYEAYELGWKQFICHGYVGQRFLGVGLGPDSQGCVIDAYDSTGDYLASGLDGATVTVHGNAQDQLAQIMREGRLVVHGDVGQTFMYGAKGGTVYVKGNAAGRPLINSVGRPRVTINGTCLDFLAESFMAGDPLNGGGFVILNGVRLDEDGSVIDLDTPYSGSNLFSLASGGAIYVRDPHMTLDNEQLNGGEYYELTDADWQLIKPYLEENEQLFDIPVSRLLTVDGTEMDPSKIYRKVAPAQKKVAAAAATAADDDVMNNDEESDE
ncbi:MAG: glutamate synthase [Armatimonadota bacterium]|nr:glutamate synthase [bacterium]